MAIAIEQAVEFFEAMARRDAERANASFTKSGFGFLLKGELPQEADIDKVLKIILHCSKEKFGRLPRAMLCQQENPLIAQAFELRDILDGRKRLIPKAPRLRAPRRGDRELQRGHGDFEIDNLRFGSKGLDADATQTQLSLMTTVRPFALRMLKHVDTGGARESQVAEALRETPFSDIQSGIRQGVFRLLRSLGIDVQPRIEQVYALQCKDPAVAINPEPESDRLLHMERLIHALDMRLPKNQDFLVDLVDKTREGGVVLESYAFLEILTRLGETEGEGVRNAMRDFLYRRHPSSDNQTALIAARWLRSHSDEEMRKDLITALDTGIWSIAMALPRLQGIEGRLNRLRASWRVLTANESRLSFAYRWELPFASALVDSDREVASRVFRKILSISKDMGDSNCPFREEMLKLGLVETPAPLDPLNAMQYFLRHATRASERAKR